MHETLNEVFSLNIHALERLEPGSLVNKGVDMLMLPATFSPALDDSELTELKSFVEGGGPAVLSVAPSQGEPAAADSEASSADDGLLGWLGVRNPPKATTAPPQPRHHILNKESIESVCARCVNIWPVWPGPATERWCSCCP